MIRNSFLEKYRKKPKYAELDEQLLKEDDEYIQEYYHKAKTYVKFFSN